jgi:hypothetical protein
VRVSHRTRLWGLQAAAPAALALFVFDDPVSAQPTGAVTRARQEAHVARIDPSEAPEIDGDISDAVWAKATVIDDFRQRQPDPGGMPTERTVLHVMYDENNIYFAVYAYDSEPDRLVIRAMARDGQIFTGDNVQIMLDPNGTRRNFYAFTIGPSGGRWDGAYCLAATAVAARQVNSTKR